MVFARAPGKRGASKVQGGKRANRGANGQTGGRTRIREGKREARSVQTRTLGSIGRKYSTPTKPRLGLEFSLKILSFKHRHRLEQGLGGTDETRTILVLKG